MQFGMPIKNPGFIPCTVCVIGNIVVKKEYRNQGIGTHLFEYIKTIKCPEFDVQRIELVMDVNSDTSEPLARKNRASLTVILSHLF